MSGLSSLSCCIVPCRWPACVETSGRQQRGTARLVSSTDAHCLGGKSSDAQTGTGRPRKLSRVSPLRASEAWRGAATRLLPRRELVATSEVPRTLLLALGLSGRRSRAGRVALSCEVKKGGERVSCPSLRPHRKVAQFASRGGAQRRGARRTLLHGLGLGHLALEGSGQEKSGGGVWATASPRRGAGERDVGAGRVRGGCYRL